VTQNRRSFLRYLSHSVSAPIIATKVRLSTGEGPNKEGLSRYRIMDHARRRE